MKTIMLLFRFKTRYIAILLSLILIFSLSGCATTPLYSNAKIPNENLNDKYKVAIKKENIVFNSGSFLSKDSLSGKQVAIYNCLGKEIYDRIPGVGVFMVDKRPANPNIIYIHDYSNEKTWWIPNAGDVTAMAFGLLGDMIGKEPNRAVFTANVLINGKNYPIKAGATVIQPILSTNAKKLLKKVCGNFERKFINLLLVEKTTQTSPTNKKYNQYEQYLNSTKNKKIKNHNFLAGKNPNGIAAGQSKDIGVTNFGSNTVTKLQTLSTAKYTSNSYFKKLAMRVYKTDSPFIIYNYKKFNYTSLPITTTLSGCKIISVIRRDNNSNKNPSKIENYKICNGSIKEVEKTNVNHWNDPPEKIKPIIKKVIEEVNQYGGASAVYGGYTVIGKMQGYNAKSIYIHVLKGIRLIAIIK